MSYVAVIRNNKTGEIRKATLELEWLQGSLWWWTEGNYGCDCNREVEFYRCKNEDPPDHEDPTRCLGYGNYTVSRVIFPDGSDLVIDGIFDWDNEKKIKKRKP